MDSAIAQAFKNEFPEIEKAVRFAAMGSANQPSEQVL